MKNLRLKAARAAKDLSQQELADAVNVSRQTINAIEKGDYNPTIRLCRAICRTLDRPWMNCSGRMKRSENPLENLSKQTEPLQGSCKKKRKMIQL